MFQALPSLIIAQNSLQFQRWDLFLEVIRLPFLAMNDLPKTDDKWTNLPPFILDHKIYQLAMVIWVAVFSRERHQIR